MKSKTPLNKLDGLKKFGVGLDYNASLSEYTTFGLGGKCPCVLTCCSETQLEKSILLLNKNGIKFVVIGGGSKLLVSEEGIKCVVIRYLSPTPSIVISGQDILVSGSTDLDTLALFSAQNGLEGLVYATGIPGTVAGAIVGNAGAFGKQIADHLNSIMVLTPQGKAKEVLAKDIKFSYRNSCLRESLNVILEARFSLQRSESQKLLKERQDILDLRRQKHPDWKKEPCAGSIFCNIEPTSKVERRQAAGWILEQVGAKEMRVGGAAVFPKHANIIIKTGRCSSQDVYDLIQLMAKKVLDRYGIILKREIRFVGRFNDPSYDESKIIW